MPYSNPDDEQLKKLLAGLSEESKTVLEILKVVIANHFKSDMETLRAEINLKDSEISNLKRNKRPEKWSAMPER